MQESKFQEVQQKWTTSGAAFDEERKEMQRRFEERRKLFDDERRELLTRVQSVSERLATVEGRTSVLISTQKAKATPTPTSGN